MGGPGRPPHSQGFQEGHEVLVLLPRAPRLRLTHLAKGDRARLCREVDLGIDVGGTDRDMAEPGAHRVDVHAGEHEKARN